MSNWKQSDWDLDMKKVFKEIILSTIERIRKNKIKYMEILSIHNRMLDFDLWIPWTFTSTPHQNLPFRPSGEKAYLIHCIYLRSTISVRRHFFISMNHAIKAPPCHIQLLSGSDNGWFCSSQVWFLPENPLQHVIFQHDCGAHIKP